jgi:epoxyqueuosine reductase
MLVALTLTAAVKARARELGFDDVAIGPATPVEHGDAFARWLDAGHAGTMAYLERTRRERVDPGFLLPGARSVVAVAASYHAGADGDAEAAERGWAPVARYARGRDYHDVLRPRLLALAQFIDEAAGPDVRSRGAIDTSAVLERDLAARAGLGWVGKNTNVLSERLGSYFFIGIVLTTAELDTGNPGIDRCGTCRACLDACPTAAFVAPYVLDARRCISYLTIEHRGDVADELSGALRSWVFGCDVCQEVCPWNRKAVPMTEPAFRAEGTFPSPADVLGFSEADFRARFRGTAITRTKRAGLARNAALTIGARDDGSPDALERALADADPVVRRAAERALGRLRRS